MLVCGKKNGAAEAVSGKLSGTYYRHASAAPQLVGSVDNVVKGTSGIGSSIFSLAVSGNEIQVRATPGADVTIDWGHRCAISGGKIVMFIQTLSITPRFHICATRAKEGLL
jgi:hypothetical protein